MTFIDALKGKICYIENNRLEDAKKRLGLKAGGAGVRIVLF